MSATDEGWAAYCYTGELYGSTSMLLAALDRESLEQVREVGECGRCKECEKGMQVPESQWTGTVTEKRSHYIYCM